MYDLIIIGGGPAALSAGIYGARKKIKIVLITKTWGGQMALGPQIENYPGFASILGAELVNKMVGQLKKNDLEIKEGLQAKKIELVNNGSIVEVKTENGSYQSKALIIATGRTPKKLGLPNEEKYIGKGVSYCATCDAPIFKDKEVAVIGGGNAGFELALELAKYASKIHILEADSQVKADKCLQEKVKKFSQVDILTDSRVKEIQGNQFVKGLIYQDKAGRNKEMVLGGIFIAIGSVPNFFLVKDVVELNKQGEIKIDARNRTSQPNIFAAGDVTDVSHKQIVIAAGEGAKAALNAYEYLQNGK